jgi:hypothetical protein
MQSSESNGPDAKALLISWAIWPSSVSLISHVRMVASLCLVDSAQSRVQSTSQCLIQCPVMLAGLERVQKVLLPWQVLSDYQFDWSTVQTLRICAVSAFCPHFWYLLLLPLSLSHFSKWFIHQTEPTVCQFVVLNASESETNKTLRLNHTQKSMRIAGFPAGGTPESRPLFHRRSSHLFCWVGGLGPTSSWLSAMDWG